MFTISFYDMRFAKDCDEYDYDCKDNFICHQRI